MEAFFQVFRKAQTTGDGKLLGSTLIPNELQTVPYSLKGFYQDANVASVYKEINSNLLYGNSSGPKLTNSEIKAWTEIYVSFWKAAGEIVDTSRSRGETDWVKVYEAWRELTNNLQRGYSTFGFEAWTIVCLYEVAKYLRIFAIKADEYLVKKKGSVSLNAAYSDDMVVDNNMNVKLSDATMLLQKLFNLCLQDR
jgi:COP9 signalosome complex subunit 12